MHDCNALCHQRERGDRSQQLPVRAVRPPLLHPLRTRQATSSVALPHLACSLLAAASAASYRRGRRGQCWAAAAAAAMGEKVYTTVEVPGPGATAAQPLDPTALARLLQWLQAGRSVLLLADHGQRCCRCCCCCTPAVSPTAAHCGVKCLLVASRFFSIAAAGQGWREGGVGH